MNTKHSLCRVLILFSATLFLFTISCKKDNSIIIDPELPELGSTILTNKMYNQVTINSSILSDGGDSIKESGICWGLEPNPTISDFYKTEASDNDTTISIDMTKLNSNIQYYVRAYATNKVGTTYGEELSFTLWLNKPNKPVTDIDNNQYKTIRIGDQTWMVENLKVTHYRNGDPIAYLTLQEDSEWVLDKKGAYCAYDDDPSNANKVGYLYNGYAIMDKRSICPDGWHIPSKEEWQTLIDYLGGTPVAGDYIKSREVWDYSNNYYKPPFSYTNLSGFTALPGGMRWHSKPQNTTTSYTNVNGGEAFFATTEYCSDNINNMWFMGLQSNWSSANLWPTMTKECGQSVRCIKD
nr:fibrobacter succinogenes major paralogous domain-containing protein [uncultured Carboxylicivirga sp.]